MSCRHLYCTFRFSGELNYDTMLPMRVHYSEMFTENNITVCFMKLFKKISVNTIRKVLARQVRLRGPVYGYVVHGVSSFSKSSYYQIVKANFMLPGYSEWNAVTERQAEYEEEVLRLQQLHERQLKRINEQRAFQQQIQENEERQKLEEEKRRLTEERNRLAQESNQPAEEVDDVTWRLFLRDDVEF